MSSEGPKELDISALRQATEASGIKTTEDVADRLSEMSGGGLREKIEGELSDEEILRNKLEAGMTDEERATFVSENGVEPEIMLENIARLRSMKEIFKNRKLNTSVGTDIPKTME